MPDLTRDERQVLAGLELVSGGKISSYAPVGTGGAHGSRPPVNLGALGRPPTEDDAPHLYFREAFLTAGDDETRAAVLEQANAVLRGLRARTVPVGFEEKPESQQQRMDRMCLETEGLPPEEVGRAQGWLGLAPRVVVSERVARGRDPVTGRAQGIGDDVRAEIARLKAAGLSNRQVASRVGVSEFTVRSTLRKGA